MAAALRGLSQCTVILKEKNKKNKPKEFAQGMFGNFPRSRTWHLSVREAFLTPCISPEVIFLSSLSPSSLVGQFPGCSAWICGNEAPTALHTLSSVNEITDHSKEQL